MEECTSSFTDDTDTHCDYSISDYTSDTENINDTHTDFAPKYSMIHSQRKHAYRDTFGNAHIQYHDFDNQDSLTFKDKYTALLQQELQNPYWNLHDPIVAFHYYMFERFCCIFYRGPIFTHNKMCLYHCRHCFYELFLFSLFLLIYHIA